MLNRFAHGHIFDNNGYILSDLLIHQIFDFYNIIRAQIFMIGKIKTEIIRMNYVFLLV